MIDGSVLQSAQQCFEKKSRVVVKMVVTSNHTIFPVQFCSEILKGYKLPKLCTDNFVSL